MRSFSMIVNKYGSENMSKMMDDATWWKIETDRCLLIVFYRLLLFQHVTDDMMNYFEAVFGV